MRGKRTDLPQIVRAAVAPMSALLQQRGSALSNGTVDSTILVVSSVDKIVKAMRSNPRNVAYNDLYKVCEHYFGQPRQSGSSHAVFKMPWAGDPRVNIQNNKGKAKTYQVRQVLAAIDKKEAK